MEQRHSLSETSTQQWNPARNGPYPRYMPLQTPDSSAFG